MNYERSIKYLESFKRYGMKLGLDRVQNLLSMLGDPQDSFMSIHIAGTNGKGSVAAMLSAVLTKAGYRTGLYTSPHLVDYTERVRINDRDISKKKFASAVSNVKRALEAHPNIKLTEFEVLTAAAFILLSREKVDIAIIEVGLGGRLDATNVISPILSIITNISYDHMDVLGHSLRSIAGEKAGIIKPKVPLVTGEKKMLRLLQYICKKKRSRLITADRIKVTSSPMEGRHQIENTKVAVAAIRTLHKLGIWISVRNIRDGLSGTRWAGRLQNLSKKPFIIMDGAHNEAGARALREYLAATGKKYVFVIGMQKNKDIRKYINIIKPSAESFIAVRSSNPGAEQQRKLAKVIRSAGGKVSIARDINDAIRTAIRSGAPVCIAGSLYLAGDVLRKESV